MTGSVINVSVFVPTKTPSAPKGAAGVSFIALLVKRVPLGSLKMPLIVLGTTAIKKKKSRPKKRENLEFSHF